jgi:hypothetical protein
LGFSGNNFLFSSSFGAEKPLLGEIFAIFKILECVRFRFVA